MQYNYLKTENGKLKWNEDELTAEDIEQLTAEKRQEEAEQAERSYENN